MTSENQLVAFRRVIWNVGYHKILYVRQQSEFIELNIGSLKTKWNIILRHCDSSNWIMMILKQSSPILSDKIVLKAKVKTSYGYGSFSHPTIEHSWKLKKEYFEMKLINSNFNEKNTKIRHLFLEIELTLSSNEADLCKKLATNNMVRNQQSVITDRVNDFTLICSDGIVRVCKRILSEQSPVFKVMFETDMIERKSTTVQIDDIDSSTMRQVMDFLDTKSLNLCMGAIKNIQNLLYAAEKYELSTLKIELNNFLMTQIMEENVFEILEIADIFNLKRLESKCLIFIVKNYSSFSKSEHWKHIKDLDITLITKITDSLRNFSTVEELKNLST